MSTPLFIRGAKVCTDPASANGRVWFLTAYVEETGADEKLCVGLKVLRLTTQEPPRAMSCYIRLKSSEGQYTVLAKALNVRDVDDLQLFRSFRFSEVLANEKYWIDGRLNVYADITATPDNGQLMQVKSQDMSY